MITIKKIFSSIESGLTVCAYDELLDVTYLFNNGTVLCWRIKK